MYRDIPEKLRLLVEPIVEDHGFELVDVEVPRGRGPGILRITIDTVDGDGRVPVELCAEVSREVATQLDVEDAISGAYRLEVSSPGLDRMLAREKDFARAAAECQEVKITTRHPVEGRRRFRGRLVGFEAEQASVEIDGVEVRIPFAEVAKANTVYRFSRADFDANERK
ncbi:MAG: ribosome maturation factor RimP [Proteobacteria bacterium]|nr:ribosome maturation factor RimP [Pseudomonadota bacterium]